MNYRKESGQTIIEAVVALAAVFIIIVAISAAIINGITNSQFVKNQNLANKYAQQGMEHVRRIQAEDIDSFAGLLNTYSYSDEDDPCPGLEIRGLCPGESTTVNIDGEYIRNIDFSSGDEEPCYNTDDPDNPSLSLKKVTVAVEWSSGKCPADDRFCHNSTLVSCIPYESNENSLP